MSENVVILNGTAVNAELLASYSKKAQSELRAEYDAKEEAKEFAKDFKETVEALTQASKLPKGEIAKYFKARFEESLPKEDDDKDVGTQVVINRGNLYTVLNSALDE